MTYLPLLTNNLDIETIIRELEINNAFSIPLISDTTRQMLVSEARIASYVKQPEYLSTGVREDISTCKNLAPNGPCMALARSLERTLNEKTATLTPYPFSTPLDFSRVVIQKYEKDSAGITPHRDFSHSIDIIAVLILEGTGRFCLCDDRSGINPREISAEPGRVILMRGPGFLGTDIRPMHFVDRVTSERFVLGMRCYNHL